MLHHTNDPGQIAADIADRMERVRTCSERENNHNWTCFWLDTYDETLRELVGEPDCGMISDTGH